jgi:hypothetical protein
MTHLFNQTLTLSKTAKQALFVGVILASALIPAVTAFSQQIPGGGQQIQGTWRIGFNVKPGSSAVGTSGSFTNDGVMFVQNIIPNILPGMLITNGTGEWVRSGNRQFDLTWIYPVVSAVDGTYIGEFKDLARVHYNADGTLEGPSTYAFILADGTVSFGASQTIKLVRIRIEPLP